MKRILINATHAEEIRVALCKGNHLYDFDLENRTREQKKANIYKGHVTRVEQSLEAVFVEYGSERQGFLPIREIAQQYLKGNPRDENIRNLIKEGDTLIVQVEKEERGNKGAALSTYVSLAGRYLVLMPNNPRGGGISRQISGKMREDMKQLLSSLEMPKNMSVIIRTAGIGKSLEDLQHDLNHLLSIWQSIQEQNERYASPRLVHQEAGVVTRAVRDYLRDDIGEIWIDNENAYHEAANFIAAVMPTQSDKLRKYTDYEPMFARFGIEKQIETAYQREVRLPSGGSIVIDQTEAMVSIDINSAKSTKGSDVAETAYHTNLEAADEIARQLRLRDMGGLIVIDFIDMNEREHQKDVEKRLVEACRYDKARVQFGEISKFGLMEMSRQRLRPSLEESTGYICPRCHGNGMIRDLRSLSLSIMRQIEQTALKERQGEVQAEVPTDIAAFLLNEKRESLVYLEQDSGTRITILPHAHMESPNYKIHFNRDGFAPSSYERVTDSQQQESHDRGYEINWQTAENDRPEQQPTRKPKQTDNQTTNKTNQNHEHKTVSTQNPVINHDNSKTKTAQSQQPDQNNATPQNATPQAVAWLANLFAPTPQAVTSDSLNNQTVTQALESLVNSGAQSLGAMGQINPNAFNNVNDVASSPATNHTNATNKQDNQEKKHHKHQKNKSQPKHHNRKKDHRQTHDLDDKAHLKESQANTPNNHDNKQKREPNSQRESRGEFTRHETLTAQAVSKDTPSSSQPKQEQKQDKQNKEKLTEKTANNKSDANSDKSNLDKVNFDKKDTKSSPVVDNSQHQNPDEVKVHVNRADINDKPTQTIHLSLDDDADDAKLNDNKNNQPSHDKHDDRQSAQANKADTGTDNNVQNLTDTPATEPNKHNDSQTRQQPVDADDNVITEDATNVNVSDDWHALFANRYVTAKKYGKANNDPRIVMANVKKSVKNHHHDHVNAINQITGSVGQFIHQHLPDAQNQIAKDGVIACFIKAIETYHNLKSQPTDNTDNSHAKNDIDFDFSNYGYQPLTTDYLSDFVNGITPIAHHQCVQGKTDVPPAPLKPRASNDPRGSHDAKPTDEKTDSQSKAQTNAPNHAEQGKTEEANKAETAKAQPSKAEPSKAEQTTSASDTLQEQTIDTLEKYKNMIESVAEQMLPKETRMILSSIPVSTGMIPKNRKRKQATAPKTDNDTANQPNVNSNANSDKDTENK